MTRIWSLLHRKTPIPRTCRLALRPSRYPVGAVSLRSAFSASSRARSRAACAGPRPNRGSAFDAQRAQKAALPEGDRTLPVAGLLFFQYSGKAKSIRSVDLIYNGPAGKATLELQP